VAQQPEEAEAGPVTQQFKQLGSRCECLGIGHMVKGLFQAAMVIMGQFFAFHIR
jgi:hypothetical protein